MIKNYLIGFLSLLVTILLIWLGIEIKSHNKTKIKRVVDSTTVTKVDTVRPPDTSRTIKPEIPDPDTVFSDTLVKRDTVTKNSLRQFRRYTTKVSDSLLTGQIKTTVRGYLVSQNFTYTPQYPLQINVNTETRITEKVTKTIKTGGYPSIGLRGYNTPRTLGFQVTGSWTFQNGNRIVTGYDPVNNSYSVGLSYNLKNIFR